MSKKTTTTMTAKDIGKKAKKVFEGVRDTLVQKDNPNSPHKVFERMNANMMGDTGAPASPPHQKKEVNKKRIADTPKEEPRMFSEESFEEIIWGDKK